MREPSLQKTNGTTDNPLDAASLKRVCEVVNREWFTLSLRGLGTGFLHGTRVHDSRHDGEGIGMG
jgi:hypothetical protein